MANAEDALAERETGQFGVSIRTSLALEGAFGIYPEREESPPPIHKYNHLWINLSTMFRNLFNSLESKDQARVTERELSEALASELPLIEGGIRDRLGDQMRLVFYVNDTKNLAKQLPKANLKHPSTDKQRIFASLHDATVSIVTGMIDGLDYRLFKGSIRGEGRALMITHLPLDLLSADTFSSLTLLESHTGRIKPPKLWGGKLGNRNESMPFNGFTLQVFGDGSTLFSPMAMKYRRAVEETAKRDRWTPLTSQDRMRMGLRAIKDQAVRDFLLDVYNHRNIKS